MTTTGPVYASSGSNQTGIGTQAWTIGDLTADNNNYTTADLDASEISNYLYLSFDLSSIPDGDDIDAILVEILRVGESSNRIGDNLVQLVVGGTLSGNNKADAANWGNTEVWAAYGDTVSDTWGLTLTGADLKTNFYVALVAQNESGGNWDAFVDSARITVVHSSTAVNITVNQAIIQLAGQQTSIDLGGVDLTVNQATIHLAGQAVSIDTGGVNVTVNRATIELAAQQVTVEAGPVNVTVNQATIHLAGQAVSIDTGGVNVEVNTATIELSANLVSITSAGAATLIGVPDPQTITVDSTNQIDHVLGTISHAILASNNPGADSVLLKSDDDGYLQLERLGLGKAPVEVLDILGNIQLTGELRHTNDLILNPTGGDVLLASNIHLSANNWISGTTGWGIQYDGDADFRNITADSLTVEAFIADINLALAGSQIITKSVAIISRSFTIPAVSDTLFVYDLPGFENSQVFADGDYVRLRYIDRSGGGLIVGDAWGTVSSYTDLSGGEQSWTWTYVSGIVGQVITEGGTALDYGASGDGYWHVTTLDSAGSPYAEIGTWVTDPSSSLNHTVHLRLGQLDGISGIGDEWGLWAGQDTTTTYLLLSDTNFAAHGLRLSLYDTGGTETLRLNPNGPYLAIGNALPTGPDAGGDGLWVGDEGGTYKLRLGNPTGTALRWDGTNLKIRNSSNADVIIIDNAGASYFAGVMTLGTGGGLYQGTGSFAAPLTGLKLWRDGDIGRLAGYNGGTLQWYADTDGKLYAGAGAVVMDADGLKITPGTSATYSSESALNFNNGATNVGYLRLYRTPGTTKTLALEAPAIDGEETHILIAARNTINFPYASAKLQGGSATFTLQSGTAIAEKAMLNTRLDVQSGGILSAPSGGDADAASGMASGHIGYFGNLKSYKNSTNYNVYAYRPLTTKATSTSFNGDNFGPTDDQTIDLSASFSLPAGIKAINASLIISSNSGTTSDEVWLGPSTSPGDNQLSCRAMNGTNQQYISGIVNCDSNGDVYLTILNAATTVRVWIEIWGYFI